MVHNLSVCELQEHLAEPERQEQQRMVDLEVFDSLQRQLHQLGKQAQMLNCVLNEQHLAQETLKSELLEQMETFKNVHDSWTLVRDQIVQKRGWLIDETVIVSDPQQCQVKLSGISIHSDLCVSSVELVWRRSVERAPRVPARIWAAGSRANQSE